MIKGEFIGSDSKGDFFEFTVYDDLDMEIQLDADFGIAALSKEQAEMLRDFLIENYPIKDTDES